MGREDEIGRGGGMMKKSSFLYNLLIKFGKVVDLTWIHVRSSKKKNSIGRSFMIFYEIPF